MTNNNLFGRVAKPSTVEYTPACIQYWGHSILVIATPRSLSSLPLAQNLLDLASVLLSREAAMLIIDSQAFFELEY